MENNKKVTVYLEDNELVNSGILKDGNNNTVVVVGGKDKYLYDNFIESLHNKDTIVLNLEDLRKDKSEGSMYYAWQANIAMAFKDEYWRAYSSNSTPEDQTEVIHEIANQAAKNFLDILIKE